MWIVLTDHAQLLRAFKLWVTDARFTIIPIIVVHGAFRRCR
jgi:hypothetical protein